MAKPLLHKVDTQGQAQAAEISGERRKRGTVPRHQLTDADDRVLTGGWIEDNGEQFCTWVWDRKAKTLHVRHADITAPLSVYFDVVTEDRLRKRLPEIALRTAQAIKAEPPKSEPKPKPKPKRVRSRARRRA
jgi:hypothetical protein